MSATDLPRSSQSLSLLALLPALSAAISEMPDPKKNAKNAHFGNRYADLGEVLECIREPLHRNGLVLVQTLEPSGAVGVLVTKLFHAKSGEWIESRSTLAPVKMDPQGIASAITYARRYAIKAMFCMADTDDDGNDASRRPAAPRQATKPAAEVKGFDLPEDAIAAVNSAATLEALRAVAARISASGFGGTDADAIRAAYASRVQTLKPKP